MIKVLARVTYFFFLSILLLACSDDEDFSPLLGGTYEGYYYKSTPESRHLPIPLSLDFDKRNYTGICEDSLNHSVFMGQFSVEANIVTLTNGYNAVADTQWQQIMQGTYRYEIIDSTIHMSRDLQNGGIEGFRLTKKN